VTSRMSRLPLGGNDDVTVSPGEHLSRFPQVVLTRGYRDIAWGERDISRWLQGKA
jgi:hypothetical protein